MAPPRSASVLEMDAGPGASVRLRVLRGTTLLEDTTSLEKRDTLELKFSIPCAEQGVRLENAVFESNVARLGGALGVSQKPRCSLQERDRRMWA